MTENIAITIANGDGIGPEIMCATLCIMRDAGADIHFDFVEIGLRAMHYGFKDGIPPSCAETILRNKILLKAPTITSDGVRHRLPTLQGETILHFRPNLQSLNIPETIMVESSIVANNQCVVFEPACDALLDIATSNRANPSGMISAAALMLHYVGQQETALTIGDAWLKTLEDGIHTPDMYDCNYSTECVGTDLFVEAVIDRLGKAPSHIEGFESMIVHQSLT